jgi:hypothetical protein
LFSTIELVGRNEAGEESWAVCVRGSTGGSFGCTLTVGDGGGSVGGGGGKGQRVQASSDLNKVESCLLLGFNLLLHVMRAARAVDS